MKKIVVSSILSVALLTSLNAKESDQNIFGTVQLGFSHLNSDIENKLGSITLIEEQDSSSENVQLSLGYEFSKTVDLSLNYQKVFNDDVDLDNIFLQSRYKFKNESFIPYLAASLGYSSLSWNKAPILTANNDTKSGSYIVGLSTGILYPISKTSEFILDYTFSYMGHQTNLQTTSSNISEISHNYLNSISFGIKFNF